MQTDVAPAEPSSTRASAPERPTVVALIDTGINPYHDAFRTAPGSGSERYAEALGARQVNLSASGSYGARVSSDSGVWGALEQGVLYAFPGTRVLGVSVTRDADTPPILDLKGHGTNTASLIAREDPDALIVMVQADVSICNLGNPTGDCPIFTPYAAAMEWIARQEWIDVVSLSLGYPGNGPHPAAASQDVEPFLAASRLAHDSGKIIVNGAGNTVAPPLLAPFAGPPWIIAVGGAQPSQRGEQLQASKTADVVANYTEWVASATSTVEWEWNSGTSMATPVVAGTLAKALTIVRAGGDASGIPPGAFRSALNGTAVPFAPLEWNPAGTAANETDWNLLSRSLPALVPAQQGWGYVHGGLAPEIARRVLENDLDPPPEKATTAQYMAQWQSLREEYWRNAP